MKKLLAMLLILTMSLACLNALAESGKTYKIGIVLMIENGAFMDMKAGFIEGLAELGYREGENLVID